MGRTNAELLGIPGTETGQRKLDLTLSQLKQDSASHNARNADAARQTAAAHPATDQAQVRRVATNCPHCRTSLSSIDLKLERCLSCGKSLSSDPQALSRSQHPDSFTIRI